MTNKVMNFNEGSKIEIMAPVVRAEKGAHQDILDNLRKDGYSKVRVNGDVKSLNEDIVLEKNIKDTIEVIVDRIVLSGEERSRIFEAIENSCRLTNGLVLINVIGDREYLWSENYACIKCDYSIPDLEPRMFSFNNPFGACSECNGLGFKSSISEDLLVPDKDKSINEGAISTLSDSSNIFPVGE